MDWLVFVTCLAITIGTFLFWEFVAWFTHKYIMHGFLWAWHKSHHTVHHHVTEKNDLFAVVFSLPSIGLFYYFSLVNYNPYGLAVGLGILCYGIFYIIFHDIIERDEALTVCNSEHVSKRPDKQRAPEKVLFVLSHICSFILKK